MLCLSVVSFRLLYLDSVASFSIEIHFFQFFFNHFESDSLSPLLLPLSLASVSFSNFVIHM